MMEIGAIFGGPEGFDTKVYAAISKLTRLKDEGHFADDTGSLDVVFHVPGSITRPDYSGARTGRLWRKRRKLQVQISVPVELMNSKDDTDAERFVINALREAVRIAEPVFAAASIPYRREQYERMIERIERSTSPN